MDRYNSPDQLVDLNYEIMVDHPMGDLFGTAWPESEDPPVASFTLNPFHTDITEQPARVFTELGGWTAHHLPDGSASFVVPAQNIRNDGQLVVEIPPNPVASPPGPFPRLHLADRVYPAPLTYDAANGYYRDAVSGYQVDPLTGDRINPDDEGYLLHLLTDGDPETDRSPTFYSWTAIHNRYANSYGASQAGSERRDLLVTIVATHRLNVNARYARQREREDDTSTEEYNVNFDTSAPVDQLLRPEPYSDANTDMVFPVPWLVMFNRVDLEAGEIVCTAEVARLLPRGSFFVVAVGQEELYAGTPHQVIDSVWDPSMLGYSDPQNLPPAAQALLTIAPKIGATVPELYNLAVWVFPPPISADRQQFGPRSPVIGVALEVLTW